ncbi:biotin--[acetyl-CoA-carboxylase] ligase [Poriferisphaera sp. WC338]|uniref:biotin--[acetyl-CoA-carboxylase] ligase n=1 Tax=Poriferisphaera sp. WC338 TaxID=3425129 RepID=UPI003D814814
MPSNPQTLNSLLAAFFRANTHQSIHTLSQVTKQSPQQTATSINHLQAIGCIFDHHPQQGYRLIHTPITLWTDYLEAQSHPTCPHNILVYNTTASTQDVCKHLLQLEQQSPDNLHNTIVIASHQTAGRGRLGRKWISPPGTAITLSTIHNQANHNNSKTKMPPDHERSINYLSFAVSVAIARTVEYFLDNTKHQTQIKWPNDVWVDHRKIAGILVETVPHAHAQSNTAVVGIGLNVSITENQIPENLRTQGHYIPTSLSIAGCKIDRLPVIAKLIAEIDHALEKDAATELLNDWRKRCLHFNQPITCKNENQTITGTVVDLDPQLGLIVRTSHGQLTHLPAQTTTLL